MTEHCVDIAIRGAIGGDTAAISWIVTHADTIDTVRAIYAAQTVGGTDEA